MMHYFKKKKNKVLITTLLVGLGAAIPLSGVIYLSNSKNTLALFGSSRGIKDSILIPSDKLDLDRSINSITDNNIKDKIVEEKSPAKVPKPNTVPDVVVKPEAEAKIEPKPPTVAPKVEETKPNLNPGVTDIKINFNGVHVNAKVEINKDREVFEEDVRNGIVNPNRYQNISVNKILSIEVTEELRRSVLNKAINSRQGEGLFDGTFFKVIDELHTKDKADLATIEDVLSKGNPDTWNNNIHRFKDLLDSNNVVKFLKSEAAEEYPDKKFASPNQRYIWLILNLDQSKFTKIASTSEKYLREGLTIDPRNAKITADGEIDAYAWSPHPDYNTVTSRMKKDNWERRVFNYNTHWGRTPDDIENGKYEGWTKSDVTNTYKDKYNVDRSDGIIFSKLERKKKIDGQLNEGLVVEIDAANSAGYYKTLRIIKELKEKKENITSVRIKNMGETDSAQKFKEILKELPNKIPQLELFFSASATNTSSLIALENKEIKELSLYTLGNSLQDNWSFNPWSFRNTKWINSNDYNVSRDFGYNKKIPTRITFNTLAFDQEDWNNGDFSRINNGLRMAYYTRNNEPIFQGGFGPGLNPDHNEGNNSYPTGLDFSRVQQIKSLRNLVFSDIRKNSNNPRKIWRLTLYNNSEHFEIDGTELEHAGFENFAAPAGMNRPKILFSNEGTTKKIRIKGSKRLQESAFTNLSKFFEYNDTLKNQSNKTIQVEDTNSELARQLGEKGYTVESADNGTYT